MKFRDLGCKSVVDRSARGVAVVEYVILTMLALLVIGAAASHLTPEVFDQIASRLLPDGGGSWTTISTDIHRHGVRIGHP